MHEITFEPETTTRYLRLAITLLERGAASLGHALARDALCASIETLAAVEQNVRQQVFAEDPPLAPKGIRAFARAVERGEGGASLASTCFVPGSPAAFFALALRDGETPATSSLAAYLVEWIASTHAVVAANVRTAGEHGLFVPLPRERIAEVLGALGMDDIFEVMPASHFGQIVRPLVLEGEAPEFVRTARRDGFVGACRAFELVVIDPSRPMQLAALLVEAGLEAVVEVHPHRDGSAIRGKNSVGRAFVRDVYARGSAWALRAAKAQRPVEAEPKADQA